MRRPSARALAMSAVLLPLALAWLAAAWAVPAPPTEPSAYTVGAAANLAAGRGLVTDSLWSYALGPLAVPRPAFDLWMPLSAWIPAGPMAVLGGSLAVAQAAFAVLALVLAGLVVRLADSATTGLEQRRRLRVGLAAVLLLGASAPLLRSIAGPDSALPFTVCTTAACLVAPAALRPGAPRHAALALGCLLGLAYLARQEALWVGVAVVLLAARTPAGERRAVARRLAGVAVVGALTVGPWLLRNALAFEGSAFAQALENAWIVANPQVFAFADRPSFTGWLAQGPATIIASVGRAIGHQLVDDLLIAAPGAVAVGAAGLLALRGRVRATPALALLGLSSLIIFLADATLFPVATLWGTFAHASGPAVVLLAVSGALGIDALLDRAARVRGWRRPSVALALILALGLSAPFGALSAVLLGRAAARDEARMAAAGRLLAASPLTTTGVVLADLPVRLALATGRVTAALPDEGPEAILALASRLGATAIVLLDRDRDVPSDACLVELVTTDGIRLYAIGPACTDPGGQRP